MERVLERFMGGVDDRFKTIESRQAERSRMQWSPLVAALSLTVVLVMAVGKGYIAPTKAIVEENAHELDLQWDMVLGTSHEGLLARMARQDAEIEHLQQWRDATASRIHDPFLSIPDYQPQQ